MKTKLAIGSLLAVALMLFSACNRKKPDVIVLDDYWNVDYAKIGCSTRGGCIDDPVLEVRDWEGQLASHVASDSTCNGVRFVRYNGPSDADEAVSRAMAKPHWFLMVNYNLGETTQPWKMLHSDGGKYVHTNGEGTPKEVAHAVCAIVTGRGGSLEN